MNMKTKLTIMLAAMVAFTGTTMAQTGTTTPATTTVGQGNCDLMASNTVRAIFRGIQLTGDKDNSQVAVFEVVQNLAHKRHVRYGDGLMPAGMIFTISLDPALPGQPTSVIEEISKMQSGEEAVIKIDHLFLFDEPQGINIRPCTRLARKPAMPAAPAYPAYPGVPQQPAPVQPDPAQQLPQPGAAPAIPGPATAPAATGSGILYGTGA